MQVVDSRYATQIKQILAPPSIASRLPLPLVGLIHSPERKPTSLNSRYPLKVVQTKE